MHAAEYAEQVLAAYHGEVGGEALFSRLLELTGTPVLRRALECMLQLESETKPRLRPLLARLELSLVEPCSDRDGGRAWADTLYASAGDGWPALLATQVGAYVERYDGLCARAEGADRPALTFLAAHERALQTCLTRLPTTDLATACAPVVALLQHPLPTFTS